MSERSRTVVIGLVTAVWAINFGAGFVLPDYEPDQSINAIFMAIVGGLFALGKKDDNPKGDDDK